MTRLDANRVVVIWEAPAGRKGSLLVPLSDNEHTHRPGLPGVPQR